MVWGTVPRSGGIKTKKIEKVRLIAKFEEMKLSGVEEESRDKRREGAKGNDRHRSEGEEPKRGTWSEELSRALVLCFVFI